MLKRILPLLLAAALLLGSASCEAPAPSGVTYEIFVASFQDSDGDGCGDLQGVIDRLDYIESLGVSQIWLMPIHPSVSYHKYDVLDYYAVDPAYGTLEDFSALTAACRERGIGVILDLVVNHTGKGHPWFQQACDDVFFGRTDGKADWYCFYPEAGTNRHKVSGCAWYYEGQFGDHMPDLNLDNGQVREEIASIIAYWQELGVTGFRLDAVTSYYVGANESNADFLRFVCETARERDPDCYIVGEVWADEQTILTLYRSGIDSLFNFPAADSTGRFVKCALNANGAAAASAQADWNARLRAVSPASVDAPFLSNHDMARARGMLRSKVPNQKAAAMLYLLMPGRPAVYYGEELGMSGSGIDENKRLPMVWSAQGPLCNPPAAADQPQRLKEGADVQDADPDSLLNCYRTVIGLRRLAPELIRGTMTALDAGHKAVSFYRVDEGDSAVAVLVNTSQSETITVDLSVLEGAALLGEYGAATLNGLSAQLPPVSCLLVRIH